MVTFIKPKTVTGSGVTTRWMKKVRRGKQLFPKKRYIALMMISSPVPISFLWYCVCVCVLINMSLFLQSRRVKEENPEVSGGSLLTFNFYLLFHSLPSLPHPKVSVFVPLKEEISKYYSQAVVEKKEMDMAFACPHSVWVPFELYKLGQVTWLSQPVSSSCQTGMITMLAKLSWGLLMKSPAKKHSGVLSTD